MQIEQVKVVATATFEKLKKYQSGDLKPIVTGFEMFDEAHLPMLPGDIICIAG